MCHLLVQCRVGNVVRPTCVDFFIHPTLLYLTPRRYPTSRIASWGWRGFIFVLTTSGHPSRLRHGWPWR